MNTVWGVTEYEAWTIAGQDTEDVTEARALLISAGGDNRGYILPLAPQRILFPEGLLPAIARFNVWCDITGQQENLGITLRV